MSTIIWEQASGIRLFLCNISSKSNFNEVEFYIAREGDNFLMDIFRLRGCYLYTNGTTSFKQGQTAHPSGYDFRCDFCRRSIPCSGVSRVCSWLHRKQSFSVLWTQITAYQRDLWTGALRWHSTKNASLATADFSLASRKLRHPLHAWIAPKNQISTTNQINILTYINHQSMATLSHNRGGLQHASSIVHK